ncbi:MAG: copper homeostasis protein CutC [Rhodobacterales bacterium]|nr:copper homeostasis protein CutC [Rhodobacterales bacterium]
MDILLEVCVDSPHGLIAAIDGGADRVELCSALALGGLTPTYSLMALAGGEEMPAVAMIRPRPGDFVWTPEEVDHMQGEIDDALELGMLGIVIGANRADGRLDSKVLRELLKDIDPSVEKVLHRCIDMTPDPVEAVETAVALGFTRILTSGGAVRAVDALGRIKAMCDRARDRIEIMPGAGITAENVGSLLALLPVTQVHASCSVALPQNPRAVALGFTGETRRETDADAVLAMREALMRIG